MLATVEATRGFLGRALTPASPQNLKGTLEPCSATSMPSTSTCAGATGRSQLRTPLSAQASNDSCSLQHEQQAFRVSSMLQAVPGVRRRQRHDRGEAGAKRRVVLLFGWGLPESATLLLAASNELPLTAENSISVGS